MKNLNVSLKETGQFSELFLKYISQDESLSSFYSAAPQIESFEKQINAKGQNFQNRQVLYEVLKRQNTGLGVSQKQQENIEQLAQANCFTVTTGHQLAIATGPLYFIYKIVTTIKLAQELGTKYPSATFVPVFWMAAEDHDFEEVNHFHLFGKRYVWQKEASGAVGRLSTEGLEELFGTVPDLPDWLKEAYTGSSTLAEATRKIVNHLFGSFGLLVLDGDDKELKALIRPLIKSDLLQAALSPKVRASSQRLEEKGYKAQAFVRDHNFFYLKDSIRQRIEKEGEDFVVVNTAVRFDEQSLEREIEEYPERFSPNVLLRPLYQEMILPNLAYVGGPGELAYWLQLKALFESQDIPFPVLFPRNFVTVFSSSILQKIKEADLDIETLFQDDATFQKTLLEKLNVEKFDFTEEQKLQEALKTLLLEKAQKADKTLIQAAEAEMARTNKSLSDFYKRLDKALENRHQADLNKFYNIRKKLFPEGELQERHDNFLNFFINHPDLMERLCEELEPFAFRMNCLVV